MFALSNLPLLPLGSRPDIDSHFTGDETDSELAQGRTASKWSSWDGPSVILTLEGSLTTTVSLHSHLLPPVHKEAFLHLPHLSKPSGLYHITMFVSSLVRNSPVVLGPVQFLSLPSPSPGL